MRYHHGLDLAAVPAQRYIAHLAIAPPPKPRASRRKKSKAKKTPVEPVFEHFMQLPAELRIMIWDYALDNYTVLHVKTTGNEHSRKRFIPFTLHGFNPANIALTCREAAARWERVTPLRQFFEGDRKVRLRIDRTILYGEDDYILDHILREAGYTWPRLLAAKIPFYFSQFARRLPRRTIGGRLNGRVVKPGVERAFGIEGAQGRTMATIVKKLVDMAVKPKGASVIRVFPGMDVPWAQEMGTIATWDVCQWHGNPEEIESDSEEFEKLRS